MKKRTALPVILPLLIAASPAFAARYSSYSPRATGHDLSTAGGIVSPSATSAGIGENPAALPYNLGTSITGVVFSPNDDFDPLTMGGLITLGNGRVGASVDLLRANGSGDIDLGMGLGADLEPINTQVGVRARKQLKPSGGSFDFDAGLIINPRADTRFGFEAFGLSHGVDGYGAGWAVDPTADTTFAIDVSYENANQTLVFKPGMQVRVSILSLGVGYGIKGSRDAVSIVPGIREKFSAGLAAAIATNVKLEAYYSQMDRWAGFLSFMF